MECPIFYKKNIRIAFFLSKVKKSILWCVKKKGTRLMVVHSGHLIILAIKKFGKDHPFLVLAIDFFRLGQSDQMDRNWAGRAGLLGPVGPIGSNGACGGNEPGGVHGPCSRMLNRFVTRSRGSIIIPPLWPCEKIQILSARIAKSCTSARITRVQTTVFSHHPFFGAFFLCRSLVMPKVQSICSAHLLLMQLSTVRPSLVHFYNSWVWTG